MSTSPFSQYRSMVLGHYSAAAWLRNVVMAMWNGQGYPTGLSGLTNLDPKHFEAFVAMAEQYHTQGENDPAFMALAEEIRLRMAEEKDAEERSESLERWQRQLLDHATISRRAAREAMEDCYSWLEGQFDAGAEAADAMSALETKIREREGA